MRKNRSIGKTDLTAMPFFGVALVFSADLADVPGGVPLYQLFYIVSATVRIIIGVLQFLMLARAIISWLPIDEDNPIVSFLYGVTEPVIMPVRALLNRLGLFEGLPIDMSFFITFILLSVLEMFL